jgi:hypothetical protein
MNGVEVSDLKPGDVVVGQYTQRRMTLLKREERRGQLGWVVGRQDTGTDWISDWQLSWCGPALGVEVSGG